MTRLNRWGVALILGLGLSAVQSWIGPKLSMTVAEVDPARDAVASPIAVGHDALPARRR